MATVDDAIELLRDPLNLTDFGDPSAGLGVKAHRVVGLLHERGAESEQEALALIRKASRALGGDEVIVRLPGALRADRMGSEPKRVQTVFWVPGRQQRTPPSREQRRPSSPSAPPTPSSRLARLLRR